MYMTQKQIHNEIINLETKIVDICKVYLEEIKSLKLENTRLLEKNIFENNALNLSIKSLQIENNKLRDEVKIWKQKWDQLQNTDELIKKIMEKHNKWWVLNSVEESMYRKVIEMIKEL